MDRQLLSQAPAGAVGYRVVGIDPHTDTALALPQNEHGWLLAPFQSPDDTRVGPGTYRVLWVDTNGTHIPSENTGTIPILEVFVGPAGSAGLSPEEAGAVFQSLTHFRSETFRQHQEITQLSGKVAELREKIRSDREFRRYQRALNKQFKDATQEGEGSSVFMQVCERLFRHFAPDLLANILSLGNKSEEAPSSVSEAPVPREPPHSEAPPETVETAGDDRRKDNDIAPPAPVVPVARSETTAERHQAEDATPAPEAIIPAQERRRQATAELKPVARLCQSLRLIQGVPDVPHGPVWESLLPKLGEDRLRDKLSEMLVQNSEIPPLDTKCSASPQALWKAHAALTSTLTVAMALMNEMEQGRQKVTVTPAARDLVVWTHKTLPVLSGLLEAKTGSQLSFGIQVRWALKQLEPILDREVPENDSLTGFLYDSLTIVRRLLSHAVRVERQEVLDGKVALQFQRAGIKPLDHEKLDELHRKAEQLQQLLRTRSVPDGPPADLTLGAQIVASAVPVKLRTQSSQPGPKAKKVTRNAAPTTTPVAPSASKTASPSPASLTAPPEFVDGLNAVVSQIGRSLYAADHHTQLLADPFSEPFLDGWFAIFEQGKTLVLHCHARWGTMSLNPLPVKKFQGLLVDKVLPLFDDVYRCVQVIRSTAPPNIQQTLRDLIEPTLALFRCVLGQAGLELLDPVGQPFDSNVHEAVDTVDAPHRAANIVEKVDRVGFRMGSQLVRPAFVVVTRRAVA